MNALNPMEIGRVAPAGPFKHRTVTGRRPQNHRGVDFFGQGETESWVRPITANLDRIAARPRGHCLCERLEPADDFSPLEENEGSTCRDRWAKLARLHRSSLIGKSM